MIAFFAALAALQQPSDVYLTSSRRDAEMSMAYFAACEVASAKGRSAALEFSRMNMDAVSSYREHLIKAKCAPYGTKFSINFLLFRAALFPALYRRDYRKSTLPDFASVPMLDYRHEFDSDPSSIVLTSRIFGDCVVRRDPVMSRAFILSDLYSPTESSALQALSGAMGQCLSQGQEVHFSRSVLRGTIGEALFKLTVAAAAAKAG